METPYVCLSGFVDLQDKTFSINALYTILL